MTQSRGRPRGRGGFRRAPRRASEWFDHGVNETTASNTADNQDMMSAITVDERKGMTLVRMIIDFTSLLSVAGSGGVMSYGICPVSSEAASAAAFPDVDSDDDMPRWLWRTRRVIAATNVNDISMNNRFVYDIKSRWRVPSEDWTLQMIIDAGALTSDVNSDGLIRTLWLKS